jgi:prepilin-type N-terminal cleavage/methylation domain-containing protein
MMRRRGFTLIELSVVITVIAMMAALVAPRLIALKDSRTARDAEAALLRLPVRARTEARQGKTTVVLRLDGDALILEKTPLEGEPTEIARFSSPALTLSTEGADFTWTVRADGTAERKTLTVQEGNSQKTLILPAEGEPRWATTDETPDSATDTETWSAGERETRE